MLSRVLTWGGHRIWRVRHGGERANRRSLSTELNSKLRFCVVGAGPSGFYTSASLLKEFSECRVDILEALPSPNGLVRYGVAPDHPEVKVVESRFAEIASDSRVTFAGNVRLGTDVSLDALLHHYHGVVLAYGCNEERALGVPGERRPGVFSARDFVGWYNSEPGFSDLHSRTQLESFLTQSRDAVIIGNGNVALDIARILLRSLDELKSTDISDATIELLARSSIRNVHIVGRRGPTQASFTNKELRELLSLQGVQVLVQQRDLELNAASKEEAKERATKRQLELMASKAQHVEDFAAHYDRASIDNERRLFLHFLKSPLEFLADGSDSQGGLAAVHLGLNELAGEAGKQRAVASGKSETLRATPALPRMLAVTSIGYRATHVPGVPFDHAKGIVPNVSGRVTLDPASATDAVMTGVYVSGWLKRGPTGIIGTNIWDASDTVISMVDDANQNKLHQQQSLDKRGLDGLRAHELLGHRVVTFADWLRINEFELQSGKAKGKSRDKITSTAEMLRLCHA